VSSTRATQGQPPVVVCGFVDFPSYSKASKLPQIQRLLELLRRKRQLEDTINASVRDLEQSYNMAADQLSLCIRARTEDLKG